jgi:hypothetical protein
MARPLLAVRDKVDPGSTALIVIDDQNEVQEAGRASAGRAPAASAARERPPSPGARVGGQEHLEERAHE